jgi:transposase-like protein
MGEALRKRRHGTGRRSGESWYADETYLKVQGRWCYPHRAIDRDGNLIDTMLSATRDMRAAQRFFRSARSVAGFVPDRVTTDGHNSYPRAIRSTLGRNVHHRTNVYLTIDLNRTIAGSKGGSDVCAASRSMTRQTGSAASMMNSATSSAAALVTTNMFLPPAAAVASSIMLASRLALCRSHDRCIQATRCAAMARGVTDPYGGVGEQTAGMAAVIANENSHGHRIGGLHHDTDDSI